MKKEAVILTYTTPMFRSVSGFTRQERMVDVLNVYNRGAGVVPPQFIAVKNAMPCGRTGFYTGMSVALRDEDLAELESLLEDFTIH